MEQHPQVQGEWTRDPLVDMKGEPNPFRMPVAPEMLSSKYH